MLKDVFGSNVFKAKKKKKNQTLETFFMYNNRKLVK